MAGANSAEVRVGANGKIYVAATTETAPTDATTALTAGWVDLGFASEDGVQLTDTKDVNEIGAWQSFYPVRRVVATRNFQIAFALRQWNKDTVVLAFGGGAITAAGAGKKYQPPSPETIDNRSMIVEWYDVTITYRLYIPVGSVVDNVETTIARTDPVDLPITFAATPASTATKAYTIFTNDTAWN